ncbi:MAG: hypothetical protein AAFQ98_17305 [Bacteroidota bacterium]
MDSNNLMEDHGELQAIITGGFKRLNHARYILLTIPQGKEEDAKAFVKEVVPKVTATEFIKTIPKYSPNKNTWEGIWGLNVAFTHSGLKKLGLHESTLDGFSRPFKEGMNDPERSIHLGDIGDNAQKNWDFGARGEKKGTTDMLLLLFASTEKNVDTELTRWKDKWEKHGLETLIPPIDSHVLEDGKEHFGFKDGIAQPIVKGLGKENIFNTTPINTGEVLLGYRDQYYEFPRNPIVPDTKGEFYKLPLIHEGDQHQYAFGTNGSYLVFRKLRQYVNRFWTYLAEQTKTDDAAKSEEAMVKLATKMVGRWPSGVPLAKYPDHDPIDPKKKVDDEIWLLKNNDEFLFDNDDKYGDKTPRGSHIRRSNPRDSLRNDPNESQEISQKHRMLRRGRTYGNPVEKDLKPIDLLNKNDDSEDRGLVFIALCGDINRQYEFSQKDWIDGPKFDDLYTESDPVIGNHCPRNDGMVTNTFSVPQCPVRHRVKDIPQFVEMKGGAYFFLPGIRALKYLTTL